MKKGSISSNAEKKFYDFLTNELSNKDLEILHDIVKNDPMYLIDSMKVGKEANEDFNYMKKKFKNTHLLGTYLISLVKNFIDEDDIEESSKKVYLKMILDEIIKGI